MKPLALALAILLGLPAAARGEEAYQSYLRGLDALKSGDCAKAAGSFRAAIAKDGKEAAKKRTYGMNFIEYYPHLQLARALSCQGDKAAALAALDASERQGVTKGSDLQTLKAELSKAAAPATIATPTPPIPTPDPKLVLAKQALDAGVAAYQQKSYDRAIASFKQSLGNDPANAEARRYLDLALRDQKQAAVARLLAEGQRAFDAKDYATAKAKSGEAQKLDPANASAKALVERAEAALAGAAPATPSPEELNRQKAVAELEEGRKLAQEGRWDEALKRLTEARRLDPRNVEILKALSDAQQGRDVAERQRRSREEVAAAQRLHDAGSLAEARTRANKALVLDSSNAEARTLLGRINAALASSSAKATPTVVAEATPALAPNKDRLREGVRAFYEGRYDEALTKLSAAERELQGIAAYHLYLGATYLSKYLLAGEQDAALRESAVASFKRARSLDPRYAPDPAFLSPTILEVYRSVP